MPPATTEVLRERPLVLGTAGHIDHGKTSLVQALTGINPDRLPEEQRRGMTIDLGFAHVELNGRRVGIVDVPGHERFIRNMVAGATGIDLALLVVAADDSVMPQTREHLEIIDLLGIPGGVVALTKIDLVEARKLGEAEKAIRSLLDGTGLEGAEIVPVSSVTGEGLPHLRAALGRAADRATLPPWPPLFRLPIDRRFTLQGHGTIVTGSLLGGDVRPGDEVELQPAGRRVRVRGVQSYGEEHTGLASGRRVAINVAGLKTSQIRRGDELAAPGFLRPTRRLAARVRCLRTAPLAIESRASFRAHLGTMSVDARFILFEGGTIEPGEEGLALLQMAEPVCATHGQRFIIRSAAHGVTIGGGLIRCVSPPPAKLGQRLPAWLTALDEGSERDRLLAVLQIEPALGGTLAGLYRESGVPPAQAESLLKEMARQGEIRQIAGPRGSGFWTEAYLAQSRGEILARLAVLLEKAYPRAFVEQGTLLKAASRIGPPELIQWLMDRLIEEGRLIRRDRRVGLPGYVVRLRPADEADLARLLAVYQKGGLAPPTLPEAAGRAGLTAAKAEALYQHALDTDRLFELNAEFALHGEAHDRLLQRLRVALARGGGFTVSTFKDQLGVSRKHAIPICEYLDREGYTRRQGDLRTAGARLTAETGTERG